MNIGSFLGMIVGGIGRFFYLLSFPARWVLQRTQGVSSSLRTLSNYVSSIGGAVLPKNIGESVRGWWASLREPARLRKRERAPMRAQFSQIHLVDEQSAERFVVHIGTIIGRSEADFVLEQGHQAVRLGFAQVDPRQMGAPISLQVLGGEAAVTLEGQPVTAAVPLRQGARLAIDSRSYRVELFAWNKTPISARVDAAWATATGPKRSRNEDAIGIYQHRTAYLFAVADGVGGGEDGDRVSEFAIRYLLAAFDKNVHYPLRWRDILAKAFVYINAEVRHYGQRSPQAVGTTLSALVIQEWEAHIAHVGDTRIYLSRGGALRQLTTDHVRKVAQIESTRHAVEEGEEGERRDVLMKAIGKADDIQPDLLSLRLQPNDRLLLCSDGLLKVFALQEIARAMQQPASSRAADLVAQAEARGVDDNVSVIALDVLEQPYVEDTWEAKPSERVSVGFSPRWPLRLTRSNRYDTRYSPAEQARGSGGGCAVLLLIAALLAGGWVIRNQGEAPTPDSPPLIAPATFQAEPSTPPTNMSGSSDPGTTLSPTPSPSLPAAPSSTPSATSTPAPTSTATPSPTPPPTSTPLPPTSTLRPSSG